MLNINIKGIENLKKQTKEVKKTESEKALEKLNKAEPVMKNK